MSPTLAKALELEIEALVSKRISLPPGKQLYVHIQIQTAPKVIMAIDNKVRLTLPHLDPEKDFLDAFPQRLITILARANIFTLSKLKTIKPMDAQRLRGMGAGNFKDLMRVLVQREWKWTDDDIYLSNSVAQVKDSTQLFIALRTFQNH